MLERKDDKRKAECINKMEKEFQGLEEGPEMIIYLETLIAKMKKEPY